MLVKALILEGVGGAGKLRLVEAPDPMPGKGELLVRVRAVGINVGARYRLEQGADAHRLIEEQKSAGKVVLER